MATRWIDIPSPDHKHFGGFLATPPTGNGPGILLIQEIFGVNAHIRAVAEQYALDGYTVLAPDLFWRQQARADLGYGEADFGKGIELMQRIDAAQAAKDLAAAARTLRGLSECTGKIAAIGYCFGGQMAYRVAAEGAVDAAVCYYGGGIGGQLALADKIRVPIQFHYAEQDGHIPMTEVDAVRQAFASHPTARVHVYAGADHGFNCWARPMYQQRTAALARGRVLEFLSAL
jgi:carboxymethylenebutenolidase